MQSGNVLWSANVSESHSTAILPSTGHVNLSSVGFRLWASHFLQCRKSFVPPEGFSPVPYFLLCLAIELELKARHLVTLSQDEVRDNFGHDLLEAYNDLPLEQHTLSAEEFAVLETANSVYRDIRDKGGFKYFPVREVTTGFKSAPSLAALDALATKLVEDPW